MNSTGYNFAIRKLEVAARGSTIDDVIRLPVSNLRSDSNLKLDLVVYRKARVFRTGRTASESLMRYLVSCDTADRFHGSIYPVDRGFAGSIVWVSVWENKYGPPMGNVMFRVV